MKVLVIDDHAMVRRALRSAFAAEARIEMLEAADLWRGIELCAEAAVVVLDLYLPGLSGVEAVTQLRPHLERRVPLIVYSNAPEPELKRAVELGADTYVSKDNTSQLIGDIFRLHESATRN